jgi:isopenicillin-N epimerase
VTPSPPPEPIHGARLLFSLDSAIAYLNHGSFGAVPIPVQRAQQRLRDEMENNPEKFFTSSLHERIGHARRHLSRFLGADPDSTAFVANATAGVALVLHAMSFKAGDEIITTGLGYGAVAQAVEHACARTGATHTIVPIRLLATDDDIVTAITRAITPGRTRLLIVDEITSASARLMPAVRLATVARQRDVALLVDGAHAPGTLGLKVSEIGADFWVGNLHKWMFAPRPTGILSVAAHRRNQMSPMVASWYLDDGYPTNLEMQGTLDYTAWLAAPTGLYVMRTLGVDRVRAHNAALAAYGQRVVGAALGLLSTADLPHPGGPGAAMRILPLPAGVATTTEAAIALRARIADELRVVVNVGALAGRGLLRLSAQVYNHPDEYDRLAAGLPGLLARVR